MRISTGSAEESAANRQTVYSKVVEHVFASAADFSAEPVDVLVLHHRLGRISVDSTYYTLVRIGLCAITGLRVDQ